MQRWQLQEAKARFSALVREAAEDGPQMITVRGRRAAVLLSADDYDRLKRPKPSLAELLRSSPLAGLDLEIERDRVAAARRRSVSFLVDTCALSEMTRPKPAPRVSDWFDAAAPETLFISVLTLGEIRKGIEKARRRAPPRPDRRVAGGGVAGLVRRSRPAGRYRRRRRVGAASPPGFGAFPPSTA